MCFNEITAANPRVTLPEIRYHETAKLALSWLWIRTTYKEPDCVSGLLSRSAWLYWGWNYSLRAADEDVNSISNMNNGLPWTALRERNSWTESLTTANKGSCQRRSHTHEQAATSIMGAAMLARTTFATIWTMTQISRSHSLRGACGEKTDAFANLANIFFLPFPPFCWEARN